MRDRRKVCACLCALLLPAVLAAPARTAEASVYPSIPKGVVLEGIASGVEPVDAITYDPARNGFVINGNSFYASPVDKAELKELLLALAQHNHVGVSIRPDRSFFTYGRIQANSRVARALANADRLLGGVVFAMRENLGDRRLPGGYTPRAAVNRRILSASTFAFRDYVLGRDGQGVYRRAAFNLDIQMTPVRTDQRARDGGYLFDHAAAARGDMDPADRDNYAHLMQYKNEYLIMPELQKAANIGEAAAFIRLVRGGSAQKGQVTGGRSDLIQSLASQIR